MSYQKPSDTGFNPNDPNVVYVGEGCSFKGVLQAPDALIIDGTVEGELTARSIRVGPSGVVKGNIVTTDADIMGLVSENIEVKQLLTVRSSGRIEANATYGELHLEKGGVIMGTFSSTDFRSERKPVKDRKDKDVSLQSEKIRLTYENGRTTPLPETGDVWDSQNPN